MRRINGSGAWTVAVATSASSAVILSGCACSTSNSFDQAYCQIYSEITPGPALAIGAAFFLLVLVAGLASRRLAGPGSESRARADRDADRPSAPAGPPWDVTGLGTRRASEILDELNSNGAACARMWERYDGKWLVEVSLPAADPPFDFVSTWTTLEEASREAVDALIERGLLRSRELDLTGGRS